MLQFLLALFQWVDSQEILRLCLQNLTGAIDSYSVMSLRMIFIALLEASY
jgi:hypothetical protein